MSNPRTFLLFDTPETAQVADSFVFTNLQIDDDSQGNQWSGIWVKPGLLSDTYGIVWGAPVADIYGQPQTPDNPDGDPALILESEQFDQDGISNWVPLPPPEPDPNQLI